MAEVTRQELEAELLRLSPDDDKESEGFKAQMVLLASAHVGPNQRKIAKLTGVDCGLIAKFNRNLRNNGIWKNGKVHANWTDPEEGGVAFGLDTCVALGLMNRTA